MLAIEYSYKLDRKNYFNLWCELGRLLLRQSHIYSNEIIFEAHEFGVGKAGTGRWVGKTRMQERESPCVHIMKPHISIMCMLS